MRVELYRSGLLLLALAAGVTPVPLARADGGCFEEWWRARIDDIGRTGDPAASVFAMDVATHLENTASVPDDLVNSLDEIAARPGTDPLLAAEIDGRLLARDIIRDDLAGAARRRARLGIVERFLVGAPGASTTEIAVTTAEPDTGDGMPPAWRPIEVAADGRLPLAALFHPAENTSASAVFWIEARNHAELALRFGADDSVRVYVDGLQVGGTLGDHEARFDQHATFFALEPGWHRVRFEVEQQTDDWSLIVRVTAPDGGALDPALSVRWPAEISRVEAEISARDASPVTPVDGETVTDRLERAARRAGPAASARLAADLLRRQIPDRRSVRAIDLVREALERSPEDRTVLWAVSLVERDATLRREALEILIELDPDNPAALRRLAHHYVERGNVDEALRVVERARAACESGDAYLDGLHAVLTWLPGAPGLAAAGLARSAERRQHPGLVSRLARLLLDQGLTARARAVLEDALERTPGDLELVDVMLDLTSRASDAEAHRSLLRAGARRQPHEAGWRLRLARSLLGDGNAGAAWDELSPALDLNPRRPDLLGLAGEIRLALEDVEGAERFWERAAASGTGTDNFEDRLAALTGSRGAFGDEWSRSLHDARLLADEGIAALEGDPPVVQIARTHAFRVQPSGLSERFVQAYYLVRSPEQATAARAYSITYSPRLQRLTVLEARLVRLDGSEYHAAQRESALLPDPELRIWYDTRVATLAFPRLEAGDLIEVSYRLSDRGPVNQIGEGYFGEALSLGGAAPSLATRLVVDAPAGVNVYRSLQNLPQAAEESTASRGSRAVTVIDLPDLPAYPPAPMAPPASRRIPYAVLGTMESWEQLGALYARLIRDQIRMTPDIRDTVREVTAGLDDPAKIANELYRWVIENTRYVALELGIHAIKPYDTATVFHRRHGDCKDKAALLVAMLREAGIGANIALLRTRDNGLVDTTVPSFAAFDHAIVRVPSLDLWLDGTVLHHGSHELPTPDRGALALVIGNESEQSESAGSLVVTPAPEPRHDVNEREERIEPEQNGDVVYSVSVRAVGESAAMERTYLHEREARKHVLESRVRGSHTEASVSDASFGSIDLSDRTVRYEFSGAIPRLGRVEGTRVSYPLAIEVPVPAADVPRSRRDVALELPAPSRRRVVSRYVLPRGASVAQLPRPGSADSPWGEVRVEVSRSGEEIEIVTSTTMLGGVVPLSDLGKLGEWLAEARQLLEQRLVLMELP